MGLIRNLNTGFILPQFHLVIDSKFQTVTEEYKDNNNVVSHIWDTLVHEKTDNILSQSQDEQEPRPCLHHDWRTYELKKNRHNNNINDEVMRRMDRKEEDRARDQS